MRNEYKPLTRDQLRAIWKRAPIPEVQRLLWEIHRLRSFVIQTSEFIASMDRVKHANKLDPTSTDMPDALRSSIDREPAIREDARRTER